MKGIDFAYAPAGISWDGFAQRLKADGFGFVIRYLSPDPAKNLSKPELAAYRRHGLGVVTVWEWAANAALGGAAQGHADATAAKKELYALAAPHHAPVYFAVDFDIQPDQMATLDDYLNATAMVLTEDLNGVYGSYLATGAAHVKYHWQTVAWSAGAWRKTNVLLQFAEGGETEGVQWDLDDSYAADYGQWMWLEPAPAPVTPPKPKPKPVRKAVKKAGGGVKHTVQKEPVVSSATAAAALSAAAALLSKHIGLHLTATQLHAIVTALPALAAIYSALKATPRSASLLYGAMSTIAAAAASFGLHLSPGSLAAFAPLITMAFGLISTRTTPTAAPRAPAAPAPGPALVVPAPAPVPAAAVTPAPAAVPAETTVLNLPPAAPS